MPTKERHVHKLKKHKFNSGTTVFFCMLPDCNVKIAPPLALGKRSICHRCGEEFIMNEYSIRLTNPHCEKCHKPKVVAKSTEEVPEFIYIPSSDPVENSMSLSERLTKTIQQAPKGTDEDI